MYRTNYIEIMKKLHLLKTLVDLFWFFAVLSTVAIVIFVPMFLFSDKPLDVPVKINGEIVTAMDMTSKLILLGFVLAYGFFIYGIFLFRKVLNHFSKREIFHENVIVLLNKIGKMFVIASIVSLVVSFVHRFYIENEVHVGVEVGADSFLIAASWGLFFMVLSEVFAIGKNIKEENELTI